MSTTRSATHKLIRPKPGHGFTLVELLVVIAIIAVLSAILLPALAKSKSRAQGAFCLHNTKQLTLAWVLYADDHDGQLAYNLGASPGLASGPLIPSTPMSLNWADNVLDWELTSDNTNLAKLVSSGLGPYVQRSGSSYRCPSDHVLSSRQREAGWANRVRSYSMNAMVGDAGSFSQTGFNKNNPEYIQFFKFANIPRPAEIFVFLDEHPDSIDDGYFLNHAETAQWHDLPASYHDGAASFSFSDGHAESHRWHRSSTRPPAEPGAAKLPVQLQAGDLTDFYWVISSMSVERPEAYPPQN
jgi:prepilin-type N-terminal cleavage/methylation domain-containing protein/prepilin-type processing-associated H-X9-DG protein